MYTMNSATLSVISAALPNITHLCLDIVSFSFQPDEVQHPMSALEGIRGFRQLQTFRLKWQYGCPLEAPAITTLVARLPHACSSLRMVTVH
ncbi:hypothetical protein DACRYDRAFT_23748 [Dacryopinax primogenitus]|uniref:F-box domain-containing protein n=1 Tax=Dacryopinax primogenitus (strain DJM 731) TaxID=1858805 RepID=M5FU66_DACPD|nr:uncharacterized protein DACRYDRAFT_23748 [Dacryopinax primogenitus]EJT99713.1 hypothetical protein DACRYDRAFT_23748 [Dacryopinax primogenitus]